MTLLEVRLKTRGYELDADSRVPPHIWLRYLEHLRWETASRGPEELVELFRQGHAFVVVKQGLEVIDDVGFGTELLGTIWIGRAGRSSLDFCHALYRLPERDVVAVGRVTVVYLALAGKPTPLPGFLRQTESEPPPVPLDFVGLIDSPTPEGAFQRSYRVRAADLDLLGHVNHASFATFYDDARIAAASAGAYGPVSERAGGRLRTMTIEYKGQALLADQLQVSTWLVGSDPLTMALELRRSGELLSRATLALR
ncbi:hypothetical protein ACFL6C_02965 [Myxococcota bacterium]